MNILNKKAVSVIEYALLFVIVIGAFLVMQNYIQRGIFGNWGKAGQSFAWGRQYDPQKTIECAFDQQSGLWYDWNCFESISNQENCSPGAACAGGIITSCSSAASESSCTSLNP